MAGLSISKAWEESKQVLERDGRLITTVALALVVLPQTILGLFVRPTSPDISVTGWCLAILVAVIGFAAQIALNRLAIGPSTTVGAAMRRGFERTPALVAVFLIFGVAIGIVLVVVGMILVATGLVAPPAAGQEPPAVLLLLLVVIFTLVYAILQLTIPVAAAERGGPIHMLSRSWNLGRGDYPRLLAFALIIIVGLLVVWMTGQFVGGSLIVVALGPPDPLTISALVLSLFLGIIQAAFTAVFAVMLARIYVQLSGKTGSRAIAPSSGD